ncbi:MAG: proprotein convertase P-domain-containing protein [Deltaproteobacteria bacterium]|nr:proprotein convertase P-domain-containing protein [Nannocystaceae bacterium]
MSSARLPRWNEWMPGLALAASAACAAPAGAPDDGAPAGSGGKADGLTEGCPAAVGINAADGAQRRCFDEGSGQFVATACCVDVCDGAGWREQTNGRVCAWLETPGLEGAVEGQFAPSLCCELADTLACARGERDGDACRDPETDTTLDDACCGDAPPIASCHPLVESSVHECVRTRMWEPDGNVSLVPLRPTELLEICTHEGDVAGPLRDEVCNNFPDEPVCQLDFESFTEQVLAPCSEALRDQYQCAFGTSYRDIERLPNNAIFREVTLTLDDVASLSPVEREQVVLAARQSAFDQVESAEQAFEFFDQGELNVLEFFELGNEQAFSAYEFGAGDNSFGAIFEHGTTSLAATIDDSGLQIPGDTFRLGCEVPFGSAGQICSGDEICGELRCGGMIDNHPVGAVGRCIDGSLGQSSPANEARCTSAAECPIDDGLICSGLTQFDEGTCRPAWVLGQFREALTVALPKKGKITRDIFVYGLATVPEDARIELSLIHPDLKQLKVTLIPALQDEGTPFVVFDGKTDPAAIGTTFVRIDRVIAHSGDEALNGKWTLVVEDTKTGKAGTLDGWELRFSSRMD